MKPRKLKNLMENPDLSLFGKLKTLCRILFADNTDTRSAFIDYHLIRRKYVLSRTSEHFEKDKFEPAPLLGLKLLDAGCGTNRIAQELALRGAECVCIDPNSNVLTAAQHDAQRYGAPITFLQTTVQEMVQEGELYDIILCLDLIGHCKDSQKAIWAMQKMLAPGGLIIFSAINKTWASFFYHKIMAEYVLRWIPRGTHSRSTFVSPKSLSKMLAQESLEISQTVGVLFSPYYKDWYKTGDLSCRYMGVIKHKEETSVTPPKAPTKSEE
jgi:2-polyprenyl-6-hydroxyphenyl methylase/3-demethylubiquinone-9 3-methyltransferase